MPDISYPSLTIRTEYPGTAPQEVETQISQPLEQQLAIVSNLESHSSISRAEQSDIVMEFSWNTDMGLITQEIREKMDRVRLPEEATRPLILRYDPTLDPIMRIGVTSDKIPLDELRVIVEDVLQRDLEGEEGLAAVRVKGGLEEEYQVNIDEHKLASLGLDIQQVNNKLAENNVNIPGGQLDEGETQYMIRTLNEFQSISDMANIVIAEKNGVDIRLRDFARVEAKHKEREIITRVNGVESIEVEIYKEANANIVEVARLVRNRIFGLPAQIEYVEEQEKKSNADNESTESKKSDKSESPTKPKEPTLRDHLRLTDFIAYKMPPGISIGVLTDQSIFIKASIEEVKGNAVFGGLIAVTVIFLFLRKVGTTLIIGITIPVSVIATFAPMYLSDVSLNIISLGGLALGIGMLVDNSIVVLESISRCREEGDEIKAATIRGVSEVGGAVFASTLTTIAVFFPIVFVEGVAGQVFGDMSLTVVFSLIASLLVALFFIPMLASRSASVNSSAKTRISYWNLSFLIQPFARFRERWNAYDDSLKQASGLLKIVQLCGYIPIQTINIAILLIEFVFQIIGKLFESINLVVIFLVFLIGKLLGFLLSLTKPALALSKLFITTLSRVYEGFLIAALNARVVVLAIAFGSFTLCMIYVYPLIGNELIPETRQGEFYIDSKLPVGTPIVKTASTIITIESLLDNDDRVASFATAVGTEKGATSDADEGEHTSRITVVMDSGSSEALEQSLIADLRNRAANIPDLAMEIDYPVLFSSKAPIEVELFGYDLDTMKGLSARVVDQLSGIPGIVDARSNLQPGSPEVQIIYDRKRIVQLGLELRPIAELVRNKVQGRVATTFRKKDRQIDIRVRIEEDDRYGLEDLKKLIVNPRGEFPIQLSAVADFIVKEGANEVRHIDQQRGTVIYANVDSIDLAEASRRIQASLNQLEFPAGFAYSIAGQREEMERSTSSMIFALGLALFLVYIVMASQFESLVHPLIILLTVPLGMIGVLLTLYTGGWTLNILVFIGLIMLAGIVVNNAIVLVDYINTLRRRDGMEKGDAIKKACLIRFRPILMTTMTTVLGITPMALGMGEGAEIRVPLAITVISGLSVSTLLTLIVIPCAYSLIDRERVVDLIKDEDSLPEAGASAPI